MAPAPADGHHGLTGSNVWPRRFVPEPRGADVSAAPTEIADDVLLITADGYERLRAELDWLRDEGRRELEERLRDARLDGDVVDNPALLEVLEEHVQLERRIAVLEDQLAQVRVVTPTSDGVAGLGTRVRVRNVETGEIAEYELVGALEADVGNGRVSVAAPVGKALVGRRKGDVVEVAIPRGSLALEVLRVRAAAGGRRERAA
jgi:transcription elongation factor GreA